MTSRPATTPGGGRPRPPTARAAGAGEGDLRDSILAATERVLGRRRVDELTVAEILERAEVSRASFYFHFESKHAALAALAGNVVEQIHAAWVPWLEDDRADLEQAIALAVRRTLDVWREHRALLGAVVECWRVDPELTALWSGVMRRYGDAVRGRIEREHAPRRDAPLDAAALAAGLCWLTERCLYVAFSGADPALSADPALIATLTGIWVRSIYPV